MRVTVTRVDFGWLGLSLMFFLGLIMLVLSYSGYQNAASDDLIAARSPVVCMKITGRERGAGTLKLPDKIYAEYQFKTYRFELGRKSFRSLTGVDSIAVSLDSLSGKAVLPTSGRVRHLAFLLIAMAAVGIMTIYGCVSESVKLLKSARIGRLTN